MPIPRPVRALALAAAAAEQAAAVFSGSALRNEGVLAVLDAVVRFLPPPETV